MKMVFAWLARLVTELSTNCVEKLTMTALPLTKIKESAKPAKEKRNPKSTNAFEMIYTRNSFVVKINYID